MDAKTRAIRVIKDEHTALTGVIEALRLVTANMASGKIAPDFKLLWSIIYYIEEYPEQLHHPKEETFLFPAVRARTDAINAKLDELARQHQNSGAPLAAIKNLIGHVEADIPGALDQLAEKVATYANFHWQHMRLEEDCVLPTASEVLTDADWQTIATAFTANNDPISAGDTTSNAWFRELYRRIVYLVPPPWGLGPEAH
jgi:hemerythrin-like domain-containing protein